MIGEQYLLLPGPTPVPERVLRAMAKPMVNHRGPEFRQILTEVTGNIKKIYQTKENVLIFPASGTGALEAAVVNFLSPGDKVLSVSIGVFGDRFAKIAEEFGADVEKLEFAWGKPADPQIIKERLDQDVNNKIKAVLITHNETSTGVFNDLKTISREIINHPAIIMVDAISGLAAVDLKMDEWGLDVVISGSQKAFMIPPGLSFVAFNEKALKVHQQSTNRKYYWDITAGLKYLENGQTPYTPSVSLYYGLQEALRMMIEDGMDNILKRHKGYRDMVRGAVKRMGLELLADDTHASSALTAVKAPAGIGANDIRNYMYEQFNIVLAGGQQKLNNVIFRIGHLGNVRELDLLAVLAALEIALLKLGYDLQLGAGVTAAQDFLYKKCK